MPEIRETEVERDADGRVVGYKERITEPVEEGKKKRRGGGGFGWGLIVGALLIAVAVIAFAYSQGGFQQAGREADRATAQLEEQTEGVVGATDEALQDTADTAQRATTQNRTSETATN